MDKFQNPKTIGDGTYGSVLKAVNSQNGKSLLMVRRDRCNQANEEKVSKVGLVHQLEGDPVTYQAVAPEHRPAVRSNPGAQHFALCVRVLGFKRVLTDEGA